MSQDYKGKWSNLGLDLNAHHALREVPGTDQNIFVLSQKHCPEEIVFATYPAFAALCSGAGFSTEDIEQLLPQLIKTTFAFKQGKLCPNPQSIDMIVGEKLRVAPGCIMENAAKLKARIKTYAESLN